MSARLAFVLSAVVGLLGLKRTEMAGSTLLALGAAPTAVSSLGSGLGMPSLAVASYPALIAGLLYVLSGSMAPGADDSRHFALTVP